jgi:non-ribosomal peptide synthetase component E (peptide arylation enzyme)
LTEKGLPNLWIPKKYQLVNEIPILSTGKIDFQEVKNLIE